jgi:broad-specificity NMP kinase
VKLALIGTHGVGKTTLAYETCSLLKKADYNVELVTEVARRSPLPVNEATTLEGQLWILHAQIAAEIEAAARAPHVICDRSALDATRAVADVVDGYLFFSRRCAADGRRNYC